MRTSLFSRGSILIPIIIGVSGLASMTLIAQLLQRGQIPAWKFSEFALVNQTVTIQLMVLPVSFIAMALLRVYNREGFKTFFTSGFGSRNHDWNTFGPLLAIAFTLGTTLLMTMGVTAEGGAMNEKFLTLLPVVIFVSASNAWSEEIFSRFVIVAGLTGKVNATSICWISAIIFGLPHFFGTPSGVFGVIMSGMLGWLLARSVVQTRGLGWALLIHFLQDVVIFGAGAMILAGAR